VDGANDTGRPVAPVELLLGEWRPFQLERTRPPHWSSSWWWEQQYGSGFRAAAPALRAVRPWAVESPTGGHRCGGRWAEL